MAAIRNRARVAPFAALAALGLAVAADLTVIHVKVHTDPGYHSFCAISSELNCDTVALSPYSVFLGLPIAVWGLCGYLAIAVLALHRPRADRPGAGWPGLLVVVSGVAVAASVPLAVVSKLVIHSACVMCLASWTLTALLLALSLLEARRAGGIGKAVRADLRLLGRRRGLASGGALLALALPAALIALVPRYWSQGTEGGGLHLPHGTDVQGLPWIGAEDPRVTLVEFSDYECPFCQRAERQVRALLEENGATLRVVHRQFPLDLACNPLITRPMHPNACALALAAICAGDQDRFWEMNDAIFAAPDKPAFDAAAQAGRWSIDARRLAECVASPEAAARLRRDIDAGIELGLRATPTFVIGDEALQGGLFVEEVRRRLQAARR